MSTRRTLIRPPPLNPSHSLIESALSLTPLADIGPNLYTNTRPLWHPPGARGIFGGAAIAQCLAAAQLTLPGGRSSAFVIHSMHCYFVLAGDAEIPVIYEVERVRDGKSFITRTVQARQRGRCIFTTTMSFVREGSGGKQTVRHQCSMPVVERPVDVEVEGKSTGLADYGVTDGSNPFESVRMGIVGTEGEKKQQRPEEKKVRQWIRARGRISSGSGSGGGGDGAEGEEGGVNHQAHLSALAYMSDSYFIGSVARVHGLTRFSSRAYVEKTLEALKDLPPAEQKQARQYIEELARKEAEENAAVQRNADDGRQVGMMVSLDHTIFFHNPKAFRADRWMLSEMQSPWAGDGRGLVLQRIWQDGILVATCVQEGLARLRQGQGQGRGESKL